MFSFLGAKTIAPGSLRSVRGTEGTSSASNEPDHSEALLKLEQENQQLRRELKDAHYRIRELESNLAVFISNADDDTSVEVQSVADLSLTSSATTIPTGSLLANKKREQQRKRDNDLDILKNIHKANKARSERRRYFRSKKSLACNNRDPSDVLITTPSVHELEAVNPDTVYICESDSSFDRLMYSSISESEVSDSQVVAGSYGMMHDRQKLTTYTSGYFMRVASADDSDSFSTDMDGSVAEI